MNRLINPHYFRYVAMVLAFVVCGKFMSLGLLYFLPQHGVDAKTNPQLSLVFRPYKLSDAFGVDVEKSQPKPTQNEQKPEAQPISNFKLHGIYGDKTKGFIIISESKAPNVTELVAIGGVYKGYTFVRIEDKSAILSNNNKEFSITFDDNTLQNRVATSTQTPKPKATAKKSTPQPLESRTVRREDVTKVTKDFDAIWKNIAIKEVVKNGKIEGFKVLSINNQSVFGTLGLMTGDVILAVNNRPLESYADAFDIYNNIDDYESIKLDILRQNTPKELEYEIY